MYRVVVADDEPEFRMWLRPLPEGSGGFQVVGQASTGTKAVRRIVSLVPDLAITDVHFPDPDGVEVA